MTGRVRWAALVLLTATGCGAQTLAADDGPVTTLQVRDAVDGTVRQEVDLQGGVAGEPVLAGDVVVVNVPDGVAAYGLSDGIERWRAAGPPFPAAVAGGAVVLATGGGVTARDAATGEVRWSRQTPGEVVQSLRGAGIALVTSDGATVCTAAVCPAETVGPTGGGTVALLDPATGRDRWSVELDCRPSAYASAVSPRHVLVGCGDRLLALDATTGEQAWERRQRDVRVVVAGDVPAVLDDRAVVLDPATGQERWRASSGSPRRDVPFVDGEDGQALRRDLATGVELPGRVPSTYGVATAGDLLVGADDLVLTAVRGGDPAWTSPLPRGERPITYLAADARWVVSVTATGQPPTRD